MTLLQENGQSTYFVTHIYGSINKEIYLNIWEGGGVT